MSSYSPQYREVPYNCLCLKKKQINLINKLWRQLRLHILTITIKPYRAPLLKLVKTGSSYFIIMKTSKNWCILVQIG